MGSPLAQGDLHTPVGEHADAHDLFLPGRVCRNGLPGQD